MAKTTKAMLEVENADLKEQVASLQAQLSADAKPNAVPSAASATRIAVTSDNPIFKGLPRYQPHSRIECPRHGATTANKAGICGKCCLMRAHASRN